MMKNKNSYRSLVGVLLLVFLVSSAPLAKENNPSSKALAQESTLSEKTPKFWQKFIMPFISLNKEENIILSKVIKQKTKVIDYFQTLKDDMSFPENDTKESYSLLDTYPKIYIPDTKKIHFKLGWKDPEQLKLYPMREKASLEHGQSPKGFAYGIGIAFDIF